MSSRNILDLLNDLEQELKMDHVAEHILAIALARNTLMRDLFELAEREVGSTSSKLISTRLTISVPMSDRSFLPVRSKYIIPRKLSPHKDNGTRDELVWQVLS